MTLTTEMVMVVVILVLARVLISIMILTRVMDQTVQQILQKILMDQINVIMVPGEKIGRNRNKRNLLNPLNLLISLLPRLILLHWIRLRHN